MFEHLHVKVVIIELRREVHYGFDCLLANNGVGIQEAVHHLREYLVVYLKNIMMSNFN